MNKFAEILIGLVLLVVPIYLWAINFAGFGSAALSVLKGGIIWALIGVGFLLIVLGISELKE